MIKPVKIDNVYAVQGAGSSKRQQPAEFLANIEAYNQRHAGSIAADKTRGDALDKEAEALEAAAAALKKDATALKKAGKNDEAKAKRGEAEQKLELAEQKRYDAEGERSLHQCTTYCIGGQAGRDLLFEAEGGKLTAKDKDEAFDNSDAGHALAAAKNATLWVVQPAYKAGGAMEAVLTDAPADAKLVLNVIANPSSHTPDIPDYLLQPNLTPAQQQQYDALVAQQQKNFEDWARTNMYNAQVWICDANRRPISQISVPKFGPKADNQGKAVAEPQYASSSSDITVDLTAVPAGGFILVKGWADFSAGAEGYSTARVTYIKKP